MVGGAEAPDRHPSGRYRGRGGTGRTNVLGRICIDLPSVRRQRSRGRPDAGDLSESVGRSVRIRWTFATLYLALPYRLHDVSESHPTSETDDLAGRAGLD